MATAGDSAADRFWALLIGLKAEFDLDTGQLAAAVALHADAALESVTSRELAARLTPVLATSPETAQAIRQRLTKAFAAGENPSPSRVDEPVIPKVLRLNPVWIIGGAAAIAAALVLAAIFFWSEPEDGNPQVIIGSEAAGGQPAGGRIEGVPEKRYGTDKVITPDPRASTIQPWQIALAALPIIAVPLWLWRRHREQLGRPAGPGRRTSAGRGISSAKDARDRLFETSAFRQSARDLRRRIKLPSRRLDARRTIGRTIRNAGLFTPVTASRLTMPEHIVLIERNAVHDHLADLYHLAAFRLREAAVQVRAFDFWSDPRTIVTRPVRPGDAPQTTRLEALPGLRDGQRIIVLGSASAFVEPLSERLSDWVQIFDRWNARAVLDPNQSAEPEWSATEMQLPETGWMIGPARQKTLANFARRVSEDMDCDRLLAGSAARRYLTRRPVEERAPQLPRMQDEGRTNVASYPTITPFVALWFFIAGFLLMLTLSVPDFLLVQADPQISWPLIQTNVQLTAFLFYAPLALIALAIYVHLRHESLFELRRRGSPPPEIAKNIGLLDDFLPARIITDFLLYVYVPLILAWSSWKTVFREEAPFLIATTVIVALLSALLYSSRATKEGSDARRRIGLGAFGLTIALTLSSSMVVAIWGIEPILRLRKIDLARADIGVSDEFDRVNLAESALNHADMRFARLSGADLRGADLGGADMSHALVGGGSIEPGTPVTDFGNASLSAVTMLAADLRSASFECASLRGADLSQAALGETSFRGADLAGADFTRSIAPTGRLVLQAASAPGARFNFAAWYRPNFNYARLSKAAMDGAEFPGSSFAFADLREALLHNATFDGASFVSADLTGADLSFASFVDATFNGANLADADLHQAIGITDASLVAARLCRTIMPNGSISNMDCAIEWQPPIGEPACY